MAQVALDGVARIDHDHLVGDARLQFDERDMLAQRGRIAAGDRPDQSVEGPERVRTARAVGRDADALLELGATITHHHAVGRSFRPWYDKEIDPGFIRMMQASKREVDPKWVLNPGILFDKPKA